MRRDNQQVETRHDGRIGGGDRQMGWDQGMWGARLTCVGMNAVFRHDGGSDRDSHPGCHGYWAADGVCDTCSAVRPWAANAVAT